MYFLKRNLKVVGIRKEWKRFLFNFLIFFLTTFVSISQVDERKLRDHVSVLASDSLQGRNTADIGQKMAANYLQHTFRKNKLDSLTNRYLQPFCLSGSFTNGKLTFNGQELSCPEDFGFFGQNILVHLVDSKIPVFTLEEFMQVNDDRLHTAIIKVNTLRQVNMDIINESKVKNIFILSNQYDARYFLQQEQKLYLPEIKEKHVFYINAKSIKKIKKNNKLNLIFKADIECKETENVLAFVEGTDSILKNEYVVVCAHYDHLGVKKGKIYNGADDNATGTAALLELARLIQNKPLKRSVLFIAFTGEEHGLLGSSFYTQHPILPLNKCQFVFNIDMIGRADSISEKEQFTIYPIGTDKLNLDFHQAHQTVALTQTNITLNYTYNQENHPDKLYYRSDHYNFAKKGIPSVFYFGGFHEDYHQSTDDIEKINFQKLTAVTELIYKELIYFGTMW